MRPMFEGEIVLTVRTKNHFFKPNTVIHLKSCFEGDIPDKSTIYFKIVGESLQKTTQWLIYEDFRPFYDEE